MSKTVLLLSDGTRICSGIEEKNAILNATLTQSVNAGQELEPGACCSAMLEVRLFAPEDIPGLLAGQELTAWEEGEDGQLKKLGVFCLERPTRTDPCTVELTAYDRISRLDQDLSQWLAELTGWPYSLQEFSKMVANACGLELTDTQIPNGQYPVEKFVATGVTGRVLMQWAAQAAGRFCRADKDGKLEFGWYTPAHAPTIGGQEKSAEVTPEGTLQFISGAWTEGEMLVLDPSAARFDHGILTLSSAEGGYFYEGTLKIEDYTVQPVSKVQVQQNPEDVGVVYPPDGSDTNGLRLTGNCLLTAPAQQVAQTLFEQFREISYTPCSVTVPASYGIEAGHILQVRDHLGKACTVYVMTRKSSGGKDTLSCTGSAVRTGVSAVNQQSYRTISGKVLNLRTQVDGLRVENADMAGKLSRLTLDVEGISTQVSYETAATQEMRQKLTALTQTADSIALQVKQVQQTGVQRVQTATGFTFDENGLRISKSGQPMENKLDNTGMYVNRSGETILQANDQGVVATDVKVRNYLVIGSYARLEDYQDSRGRKRTACFYLGG